MSHCRCGLLTVSKDAVPLRGIEVELEVRDHVVTVVSTLHYDNKEDEPVEAVFVFPMPADAAVCHFSAKMGQTSVVAELKEKQQAREDYDDALSSGQQAFLLEESEQSPDIFSLSVGSLPPGHSATIRLEYVSELAPQADQALRFNLPAVLNPRYQPEGSGGGSVQVAAVPASLVPYTLSLSARVSSPRSLSKVESSCPLEPLHFLNAEQTQATVKLAAGHRFDRDVELLIYYKDAHQPAAVVEAGRAPAKPGSLMGDAVVMLSLYPEFPQSLSSSLAAAGEFLFLLDRSGSMNSPLSHSQSPQSRISSARDTLMLLLKSLPVGCYFNIYSFGSTFEHVFPKSVEYNQQTMEEAVRKVVKMDSNLGGTEILEPLKHIYQQPCISNHPRQLFVFTDGEVCNTKMVLKLVKQNAASHRCFSFGIGEGASSALITGLAAEGGGHAQFITGTDRMQPKVMQSLRFALQPAVVDVSITWDLPKELSVTVLSPPITALFQGQRSLVYAQLTGQSCEAAEGHVTVKYTLAGSPAHSQLSFSVQPTKDTGSTVHRLAARTLIRSLEKEEPDSAARSKVVDLSVQSGVSSAFTAFIAINKDSQQLIQGPLVRRDIPVPRMRMYACGMPCQSLQMQMAMPVPMKMMMPVPLMANCSVKGRKKGSFLGKLIPHRAKKRGTREPQLGIQACGLDEAEDEEMDDLALSSDCADPSPSAQPPADPLLRLVSLQKACGCWELEPRLAAVLGTASGDVQAAKPPSVKEQVWASILALVWLHGFSLDARLEWELLAMKAASWLRAQSASCVSECVAAANTLLGCSVQEDALGL